MLENWLQRQLLRLEPEWAHGLALGALTVSTPLGVPRRLAGRVPELPVEVLGLRFANPLGLAAGLDKNGDHIDALFALGFGFVEVGTVTPRPQAGNPRPRLFRLPEAEAIINRMGFNNRGLDHLVGRLRRFRATTPALGVLGVNIGKNRDTPNERALDDYRCCLEQVYAYADYVTINISSPNTAGLRDLQQGDALTRLLEGMAESRAGLTQRHGRRVPLVVKIAPDMDGEALCVLAACARDAGMDAIAATNTTLGRGGVEHLDGAGEQGGLSGVPLRQRSTAVVRTLCEALGGRLPVIGIGGVATADDVFEKLNAGASLVQLYSALIYRGAGLPGRILRGLEAGNVALSKAGR
jgi:dihydroorotate dehydrogenase